MFRSRFVRVALGIILSGVGFMGCPWFGPIAAFKARPMCGPAPLEVAFSDRSISFYAGITDWEWDFGDGGSSSLRNPTHTYTGPGAYSVGLTVTSALGTGTTVRRDLIMVTGEGEGEGEGEAQYTSAAVDYSNRWTATMDTTEGEGESSTARDVVEPDVIRRDENILYVLNQYRGLVIVDLGDPRIVGPMAQDPRILAQVPTYGYPRDLYISGDRAYVLVGYAGTYKVDGNTISYTLASRIYIVDISDSESAHILSSFDLNGDFVDSRLVGDVLYAVSAEYQYQYVDGGVVVESRTAAVTKDQTSSSWVTSINIADPDNIHEVDEVSFDGLGNIIQATNSAIFVAAPDMDWWTDSTTTITYVDISDPAGDITVRDAIVVPGQVADRFKMDAYNGVLRVVSAGWDTDTWVRRVHVITVNLADPDNLSVLGATELDNAVGESLFATRFDGTRGYIVTYLTKDPLFVLDFSDPASPKVAGELIVPGWSTYIEPRGNYLLALGVDDTDGRRVSVSMFDVSKPEEPTLVGERATFGDNWSWSSAYSDVKAFTVLDDVIIIPFSGWEADFGGYDRLQFISYSADGLTARGYVDVDGQVMRSFEYEDRYYGVTTEQLASIDGTDLDHPEVVHRLTLAEYVTDFVELPPTDEYSELDAEVITQYDAGRMIVRTLGPGNAPLGEVEVEIGSFVKAFGYGPSVVLVGSTLSGGWLEDWTWQYEGHYTVAIVDCSTPAAPTAVVFKVDVPPYANYYWYCLPYGVIADRLWYPWWQPKETAFLLGNTLALRCTGDTFDAVFGDGTPIEGLALVDLTTQAVKTVGFGYASIVSLDASGGKLYLGTQQLIEGDPGASQQLCAYYLREIDVTEPSIGPAANVPGIFVQYDPAADLLTLRDNQWTAAGGLQTSLKTASWDGQGDAALLDAVDLPEGMSTMIGRGSRVYFDVSSYYDYTSHYMLYAAYVSPDGGLSLSDKVLATDYWGSLLDGHGTTAYVSVGGAVARYDFTEQGALIDLTETMGYPESMRFGTNAAWVLLGYSGVMKLPL